MKNFGVYFLLVMFCFNIFSASIAEFIHFVDHSIRVQKATGYVHTHDGETHSHGMLVEVTKDIGDNVSDFPYLWNLSLLMLALNAILSESNILLGERFSSLFLFGTATTSIIFACVEIPTPPPRLFA